MRRSAPATVVRVRLDDRELLVALSRSQPGQTYVLQPGPDGRLLCQCEAFRRRWRCAHVDAAELVERRSAA